MLNKKIQVITYSGNTNKYNYYNIEESSFGSIRVLDDFDINIVDLNDETIWRNNGSSCASVNCIKDLKTIGDAIQVHNKTKVITLLPANLKFKYHFFNNTYKYTSLIKDEVKFVLDIISNNISQLGFKLKLSLYNVKLGEKTIHGDFIFDNLIHEKILIKTDTSNLPVAIDANGIIFTTLIPQNGEDVIEIIKALGLIEDEKGTVPEWFRGLEFFDDTIQKNLIEDNKRRIDDLKESIHEAEDKLAKNNKYKSVLYTNGDELVESVFEILEDMLKIDLSVFEDLKKEDFRFESNGVTYIGEIKGIASNVKNQNLSQLENHYRTFLDDNPEYDEDNVRQILIINHQRNINIFDRDPIDHKQIHLAERYGSLIVDTLTLLKMYEKYKNKEISSEECLKYFDGTGLATL